MNSASLCSLAGRYNNPIPTGFLAPIDCLKIPTLYMCVGIGLLEVLFNDPFKVADEGEIPGIRYS